MTRHRPQVLTPSLDAARVALVYKNFAAAKNISHIGLGVAALNTCKVLRAAGIDTVVWACKSVDDLRLNLAATQDEAAAKGEHPISHVAISAPWIATDDLNKLCSHFPNVVFSVVSHSNVGFLQADANGVRLLRESFDLSQQVHNFNAGGNCRAYVTWVHRSFEVPCVLLPNLYYLDGLNTRPHHRPWHGGTLRIGCFGAMRPLKNHLTAAAAALSIARSLNADLEFWMNSGRSEGGGNTVRNAVHEMLQGLPGVSLKEAGWAAWSKFRSVVRSMHLLIQPSYTESFLMVVADGIAESVPSVVSDAVDWAPASWKVSADEPLAVADTGRRLILDSHAAGEGRMALESHNDLGISLWQRWLMKGNR